MNPNWGKATTSVTIVGNVTFHGQRRTTLFISDSSYQLATFSPPLEIFKARRSSIFESKKIFNDAGATDDAWIGHGVMVDLFAYDLKAFRASIALPIGEG